MERNGYMKQKYDLVYLGDTDRQTLKDAIGKQDYSNQIKTRTQILLALDENRGPVKRPV